MEQYHLQLIRLSDMLLVAGSVKTEETPSGPKFLGPDGNYLPNDQVTQALIDAIDFMASADEAIKEFLE